MLLVGQIIWIKKLWCEMEIGEGMYMYMYVYV
jgi:hypothetical protein